MIKTSSLENTNFTILTETWLKDTDKDRVLIATSGLVDQLQMINRSNRQGGWVALLHKGEYQTTRIENNSLSDTIDYGAWEGTVVSSPGKIHIKFLDEVSQIVQYFITNHTNLVLLGDFNIHVQGLANLDSLVYNNTMEAMGLIQHIIEPTHQLGNTLDFIYTESLETVKVLHAFLGDYISHHKLAVIE